MFLALRNRKGEERGKTGRENPKGLWPLSFSLPGPLPFLNQ